MAKVVNFKNKLSYFLKLIDKRSEQGDLWGVLDATRNAVSHSKTRVEKEGLDLLMGQVYFDMGQHALAIEFFFRAVRVPHLRASAFFGVARSLCCIKKFNLALDYLEATIKWDMTGTFCGAVLEWTHFIKESLKDPKAEVESLMLSAKHFLSQRDFKCAREILSSLKSDNEVLGLLALLNLFEEDYFQCEQYAKKVLFENEFDPLANCVLVEVYQKKNNEKLCKKQLEKLEEIETEIPDDLLKIALTLSRFQKFDKAEKFFEKLCLKDEFNAKNHFFCGLCKFNIGKIEDALVCESKARWLDGENPLYLFFFELIKTGDILPFVEIKARLPKQVQKEKIENLLEIFFSGNFSKEVQKSFYLLEDVKWSFSLKDLCITDHASNALFCSGNKEALKLAQNLMLSPKLSARQKFLMTKNALLSNKVFQIDFVCNFHFSSFKISKNELSVFSNPNIKNGVCEAISYAECFFPKEMILEKIVKKSLKINKISTFLDIKSAKVACLLLWEYPSIFVSACLFFDVNPKEIEDLDLGEVLK
mgnify:CR=1 FL=1